MVLEAIPLAIASENLMTDVLGFLKNSFPKN